MQFLTPKRFQWFNSELYTRITNIHGQGTTQKVLTLLKNNSRETIYNHICEQICDDLPEITLPYLILNMSDARPFQITVRITE